MLRKVESSSILLSAAKFRLRSFGVIRIWISDQWAWKEPVNPWPEWISFMRHNPDRSWITDPDPDHPKGTQPISFPARIAAEASIKFSNLNNWKEEAWKNQGFNGIRTNIKVTMCGFHSSVGRASHKYRGGHGFESRCQRREAFGSLDFFRLLLSNCLNWKIYCDDHSSLWSTTAVQI